jgi:hypothetical protein
MRASHGKRWQTETETERAIEPDATNERRTLSGDRCRSRDDRDREDFQQVTKEMEGERCCSTSG